MTDVPVAALRPLGVAEILDGAVRAVRRNLRVAMPITLPFAVVSTALNAALQLATVHSSDAGIVQLLGSIFLSGVVGTALAGLLAPAFVADLLGERITAAQTLRRVGRAGIGLAVLAVIVAVSQELGLALLVVGGVWLWGVWAVAAPALVMERAGPFTALRRSFALVAGSFWRTWGVRALGWVLTTVLGLFVTLPFTALAAILTDTNPFQSGGAVHQPGVFVTVTAIGALIGTLTTAPITAAIQVLLYTDLRMRREGMDLVMTLPAAPQATVSAW